MDVTFLDADHDLNDALDAVYRDKYRRYSPSHARPHHQPRGTIYHHPARAAVNKPLETCANALVAGYQVKSRSQTRAWTPSRSSSTRGR